MKETSPLIEIRDLRKSYMNDDLETPVLFGPNLTIQRGEFVTLEQLLAELPQ